MIRTLLPLLVLTPGALVHAARDEPKVGGVVVEGKVRPGQKNSPMAVEAAAAAPRPAAAKPLPAPVAEMREAILAAVHSGRIEDLITPLQWNELPPEIADATVPDPIAHWKGLSGDGEGREILAVLGRILDMPHAHEPLGRDIENNAIYVWPYLAAADLAKLTPAEEVDLYRLMSPAEAKTMREAKHWNWWRLAIGADGTWHTFRRMP